MRQIKFRRPHFRYKDNQFDSFTFWGTVKGGFQSPSSLSSCYFKEDQQYTGLKDKNGKEIYEGDIMRVNNNAPTHEVFWCEDQFGWKIKLYRKGVEPHWFNINCQIFEVVGNIYENPELLS